MRAANSSTVKLVILATLCVGRAQSAHAGPMTADPMFPRPEPITAPLVIIGGGVTLDHWIGSINLGLAVGEKTKILFPGSEVQRVLFGVMHTAGGEHRTALSLTYGWYENEILTLGFDLGALASQTGTGTGPIARFTAGYKGCTLQLTTGVTFDADPHFVLSAELALQLADLASSL